MRTFLPVAASRFFRKSSTFAPPLPMTIPGFAAWIVTPTWFADRSISTRGTPASASRRRIVLRIVMSSLSSVGKVLLSANHFADRSLLIPSLNPIG